MEHSKDKRSLSDHHIDMDRCASPSEDTSGQEDTNTGIHEESQSRLKQRRPFAKLSVGRVESRKASTGLHRDEDLDISTPYILGFLAGWFTWVFGFVLLFFGGDGRRTAAMRRGLMMGVVAVTLPLAALLSAIIILVREFKDLLDAIPSVSVPDNPFQNDR